MCLQSLKGFGCIYISNKFSQGYIRCIPTWPMDLKEILKRNLNSIIISPCFYITLVLKKDRVDKKIEVFLGFLQTYFTGLIMMYFSGAVTLSLNDCDVIFILLWTLIIVFSLSPCKNDMLYLSMNGTWLWLIPCEWPSYMATAHGKQVELKGLSSRNANKIH